MNSKFPAVFYLVIPLLALPCMAGLYRVNADGSGDYASIQACATAARAGDTCSVEAGEYQGFSPRSGSPGAPIVFTASEPQTPKITGDVELDGDQHIIIAGFDIHGSITSRPYSGSPCGFIQILDNHIHDTRDGILLKGNDLLISGNRFNNMSGDMVRTFGQRWVVRNNLAVKEVDEEDVHMDFWQSFCSGLDPAVSAQFGLLENNLFAEISGGNVHFALVNGTAGCGDPPTNIIIRYNKVRFIGSMGIYVDENKQAPGAGHNVVYNNTWVELVEGAHLSWQKYAHVLTASEASAGINNLFQDAMHPEDARGFLGASGWRQEGNLYYNTSTAMTFTSPASEAPGEIRNQDPLLANPAGDDYSLLAGSPAIDAGRPLTVVASGDPGSGSSVRVESAAFFQPGWGGAEADWIAVGATDNIARITDIDYTNHIVSLSTSLERSAGDPVYLYSKSDGARVLYGSGPDIGAVESEDSGVDSQRRASLTPSRLQVVYHPAERKLVYTLDKLSSGKVLLQHVTGELVTEGDLVNGRGELDVSGLTQNLYILRLEGENGGHRVFVH